MTQKYFDKFPKITYANNEIVDITKRVKLLDKVSANPYVFYPYEITDHERPDQLASRYYDDPHRSWIIYLTNKIVDPYYEWYMSDEEFNEFIVLKYGSEETAKSKIKYYVNDWLNSEDIAVSTFDALPPSMRNYWEPVIGVNNRIISYKRKHKDWVVNTNRVIEYAVSNNSFINGEPCHIYFNVNESGRGEIMSSSNGYVYIKNVSGRYLPTDEILITSKSYIYGEESKQTVKFTATRIAADNIPAEEDEYYKALTYYDYEYARNEFNKTIRVMDSNLKFTIVDNLKALMKE